MSKLYKSFKILGTLLTLLLAFIAIVGFFWGDIPSIIQSRKYEVYLSPERIHIPAGWGIINNIQIINNNPYPIYSVQIEVTDEKNVIDFKGIEIEKIDAQSIPVSLDNSYVVDMSYFQFIGQNFMTVFVYRVDSRSVANLKISMPYSPMDNNLQFRIADFQKEPAGILRR